MFAVVLMHLAAPGAGRGRGGGMRQAGLSAIRWEAAGRGGARGGAAAE